MLKTNNLLKGNCVVQTLLSFRNSTTILAVTQKGKDIPVKFDTRFKKKELYSRFKRRYQRFERYNRFENFFSLGWCKV